MTVVPGEQKQFNLRFINKIHSHQWLELRLHCPEGWQAKPAKNMSVYLDNYHGGCGITEHSFSITPDSVDQGRYELLLEIKMKGRPSTVYLPLVVLA